jgi:transposase
MTKTRREFTPEFKREAVALLEGSSQLLIQIATVLGISPSMLRNWRAIAHGAAPRSKAASQALPVSNGASLSPADQAAEIARLRREPDRTRMEQGILKTVADCVRPWGQKRIAGSLPPEGSGR